MIAVGGQGIHSSSPPRGIRSFPTWPESRFLAATSTATTRPIFGRVNYRMTYCDVLADSGNLHIFIPHLWRQALEVRMREEDLLRLPTKSKLFG
jgi:hypothetical protein